ncbi:hypothetical protein crov217 [Cafeteria roenbergensis virus]|uniref:Uncharacterized protein n=1 Tax=Cafeteria roenbergensis virus (strain BV-PW1) TaxID=693272 RepID=E3T4Y7_CROVB|nr:hypothetical protein crov217 [Cafeteria roenbergensis virus BV-PW1]ADO67250.1 hypothetical protein crov217 [Cafeteria roenbergensis virus BV-PW1]
MNSNPYSTYIYYIINNKRFSMVDANEWQTAIMNNEELPWIKRFTLKYKLTENDLQVIQMYNQATQKSATFIINSPVINQILNPSLQQPLDSTTDNKILFMFLGGLPSVNNKNWEKFMTTTDKSKYMIVTHPINLPYKIENYWMKYNDNILVVNNKHHVKTKWATRSLVDATILMMQYALEKVGNIFKKIVLIDGSSMPLYNFNVMYKELCSDNKSWFSIGGDGYARNYMIKPYKYMGGPFDINDVAFGSQWFSLDRKHLSYFIKLDDFEKSYEIKINKEGDKKLNKCGTNYIESKYKELQDNLDAMFSNYNNDIDDKYCGGVDEVFFHVVVKNNVGSNINENFKLGEFNDLKKRSRMDFLNINTDYDNSRSLMYNIYVNNNKAVDGIWISDEFKINTDNIQKMYIFYKDTIEGETIYYMSNNKGKIIKINQNTKDKLCSGEITNVDQFGGNYNHTDGTTCKVGEKQGIQLKNKYGISTTYTDWTHVSLSPDNVLRGLKLKYFYNNYSHINIDKLIKDNDTQKVINLPEIDIKDKNLSYDFLMGPPWHPLEYYKLNLIQIANGYNLFKKLHIMEKLLDDNYWTNIVINCFEYMSDILKKESVKMKDGYYIPDKTYENTKLKYGYDLNNINLNNALKYGALFIRKVKTLDFKYMDNLLKLSEYVPKSTSSAIINSNISIFRFSKNKIPLENIKSIDNQQSGHIKPPLQNVILNFGPKIISTITKAELIAQAVSELNPDGLKSTQSRVWVPLIWKALNLSGYNVPPHWLKLHLEKDKDYHTFNIKAKELSELKGWSEYAMAVLTYPLVETELKQFKIDDNNFDNQNVINLSNKFKKSYIGKDFTKYKMAMYLKYLKYKQKYIALKQKLSP